MRWSQTIAGLAVILVLGCALSEQSVAQETIQPPDVYVRSARIALSSTPPDYQRARRNLKTCLQNYPNYFDAHVVMGTIHAEFDDIDSMLIEFEMARSSATEKQWKKVQGKIKDIRESKWIKVFNKGVSDIHLADSLNEARLEATDSAALAKLNWQVDTARSIARQSFMYSVRLEPSQFSGYLNVGLVHQREGETDSALQWFQRAENLFHKMEFGDSTSDFYDTTLIYQGQGEETKFLKDFKKKFGDLSRDEYEGQYKILLNALAVSYFDIEQYDKALAVYKRYLALYPEDVSALVAMLNIYERLGLVERAEHMLDKVETEADPDVIYNLASFYYNAGLAVSDSVRTYEKDVTADPHNQLTQDRLKKYEAEVQEKFERAAMRFKQVVKHSPKDFEAWRFLGMCQYYIKDEQGAIESLETAWEGMGGGDAQICNIMRRIYAKQMNKEKLEEWIDKCRGGS